MDDKIIKKLFFNSDTTFNSIISICENNDPLITVLTLHLTCESFLDAYISSHLEIEDLFSESPSNKDDVKFRMSFGHKAKLAQRIGMPRSAYNAFNILDKIRNQFAHKLLQSEIKDSDIKVLYSEINAIPNPDCELDLKDESVKYYLPDGREKFSYTFSDPKTPNQLKLFIAFFSLIRRVSL